jgi:hypothetical protein
MDMRVVGDDGRFQKMMISSDFRMLSPGLRGGHFPARRLSFLTPNGNQHEHPSQRFLAEDNRQMGCENAPVTRVERSLGSAVILSLLFDYPRV